jgi:hypothetical protein
MVTRRDGNSEGVDVVQTDRGAWACLIHGFWPYMVLNLNPTRNLNRDMRTSRTRLDAVPARIALRPLARPPSSFSLARHTLIAPSCHAISVSAQRVRYYRRERLEKRSKTKSTSKNLLRTEAVNGYQNWEEGIPLTNPVVKAGMLAMGWDQKKIKRGASNGRSTLVLVRSNSILSNRQGQRPANHTPLTRGVANFPLDKIVNACILSPVQPCAIALHPSGAK